MTKSNPFDTNKLKKNNIGERLLQNQNSDNDLYLQIIYKLIIYYIYKKLLM
jgi:hypothetical protein